MDKVFNEKEFNQQLISYMQEYQILNKAGQKLLELKDPQLLTLTLNQLIENANRAAESISNLSPQHPDKNFVQSFRKQMKMLALRFEKQSKAYTKTADRILAEQDILSVHTEHIKKNADLLSIADIHPESSFKGLTFDLTRGLK